MIPMLHILMVLLFVFIPKSKTHYGDPMSLGSPSHLPPAAAYFSGHRHQFLRHKHV